MVFTTNLKMAKGTSCLTKEKQSGFMDAHQREGTLYFVPALGSFLAGIQGTSTYIWLEVIHSVALKDPILVPLGATMEVHVLLSSNLLPH